MADYRPQLEQLGDAHNARDADAFAAVWNPDCEWHPFLTARSRGTPGTTGQPRGVRFQRGWAYTSHAEAEQAAA